MPSVLPLLSISSPVPVMCDFNHIFSWAVNDNKLTSLLFSLFVYFAWDFPQEACNNGKLEQPHKFLVGSHKARHPQRGGRAGQPPPPSPRGEARWAGRQERRAAGPAGEAQDKKKVLPKQ